MKTIDQDKQTIIDIITDTYVSRQMCSHEYAADMADRILRTAAKERAEGEYGDVENAVKMVLWMSFSGGGAAEIVARKIMAQTSL